MSPKTAEAYEVLSNIAAETDAPIDYGHLAAILGVPRWTVVPHVLREVNQHCVDSGEPILGAFVVSKITHEPSDGYVSISGDATKDREIAHEFYRKRKWGV